MFWLSGPVRGFTFPRNARRTRRRCKSHPKSSGTSSTSSREPHSFLALAVGSRPSAVRWNADDDTMRGDNNPPGCPKLPLTPHRFRGPGAISSSCEICESPGRGSTPSASSRSCSSAGSSQSLPEKLSKSLRFVTSEIRSRLPRRDRRPRAAQEQQACSSELRILGLQAPVAFVFRAVVCGRAHMGLDAGTGRTVREPSFYEELIAKRAEYSGEVPL